MVESGGRADTYATTAASFAKALGISLEWLVTGDGDAPEPETVRAAVQLARERFAAAKSEANDTEAS